MSSLEWIAPYAPFWTRISDDGVSCNSAYGARIFAPAPHVGIERSQWEWVREELRRDPDSRRAYVHIRTAHDSFNARLDVPCTIGLQFMIRDGRLHMWTAMRSQDMILGLGNDVPAFTMFHELLALELGVQVGTYHHSVGSMHIYERDASRAEAIVENAEAACGLITRMPRMPCAPPIDSILQLERMMRSGGDLEAREQVHGIGTAIKQARIEVEPYWADIVALLGAFWFKRCGAAEESRAAVQGCSWAGWSSEAFKQ
jgi:thymidylate synthase